MIKRLLFIPVIFILLISNLAFSQVENPYLNFESEKLKKDPKYSQNFNAGNYSEELIYLCMVDLLNELRAEYAYLGPFKHDINLDSAARFQALHQAFKEEKTSENVAPYKELMFRLKKYGLSHKGYEINTKAKATKGAKEYSYYDMSLELLKPLLKNLKIMPYLLAPEYSYVGFYYAPDQYLRTAYATIILGNDLTFRPYSVPAGDKDAPISKGKGKMDYYNEATCRKCLTDFTTEALSEMITIDADGYVFLETRDYKALKKMIGKTGDAIVLDFIQEVQYDCDGLIVDNDKIFKGIVSPIITFEDIFAGNQITEKGTRIKSVITTLPEEINLDEPLEISIIIIKEDKVACKSVIRKSVEAHNARYEEKINFIPNLTTYPPAGDWMPTAEKSEIEVIIPFEDLKKTSYTLAEITPYLEEIDAPPFTVNSITIDVCNSLNYLKNSTQIRNQSLRGQSIANLLQGKYSVTPVVNTGDSWEAFKAQIVNHPDYYDMSFLTKNEAIAQLQANGGALARELEEEFLSKQRFAKVKLAVTYKMDGDNEQKYCNYKFQQALADKNYKLATAVQKHMIYRVEGERYKFDLLDEMVIPNGQAFIPFTINKLYMQYYLSPKVAESACGTMANYVKLYPTDPIIVYNNVVCTIFSTPLTNEAQVPTIQAQIDRLYTMVGVPKDRINVLNLEFQIKILDFLKTRPASTAAVTLKNNTYNKIKLIRNPVLESWEAAYKLASLFIENYDYEYAVNLMNPFLDSKYISEDFLFSYISLMGSKPNLIQSSNFIKAIRLAEKKNPSYLCDLLYKMSITIKDNVEVKAFVCDQCN